MSDRLPELIDPLSFADKHCEVSGQIKLESLSRLAPLLLDDSGVATINLFFNKQGRLASIEGRITASLTLACQNCLNAMNVVIDSDVKLGIVGSLDEADHLPEGYEPLLLGEHKIPLKDLIEDEILLALPDFPRHSEACTEIRASSDDKDSCVVEQSNSNNPFLILAKLKHTGVK